MKENLFSVAKELFRNIELVKDVAMLKDIDLGAKGASYYESLAGIAVAKRKGW